MILQLCPQVGRVTPCAPPFWQLGTWNLELVCPNRPKIIHPPPPAPRPSAFYPVCFALRPMHFFKSVSICVHLWLRNFGTSFVCFCKSLCAFLAGRSQAKPAASLRLCVKALPHPRPICNRQFFPFPRIRVHPCPPVPQGGIRGKNSAFPPSTPGKMSTFINFYQLLIRLSVKIKKINAIDNVPFWRCHRREA
jgi:hypothetical protein